MKNYALQTLTVEDVNFQSKNVAFVLEMADKLERLKVDSVKMAEMSFLLKWNLMDVIRTIKEQTSFLEIKDKAVEMEFDKLEQEEVDEVMIEREMNDIEDQENKWAGERERDLDN